MCGIPAREARRRVHAHRRSRLGVLHAAERRRLPRWALYVAGRYHASAGQQTTPTDPTDLREDVKFGELVAAILSSLRQSEQLRKRQASLSRFFAPAVSAAMHGADPEEVLAPRVADVSVLFCDLRGFTHAAERSAADLPGLLERVSRALGVATHHTFSIKGACSATSTAMQ